MNEFEAKRAARVERLAGRAERLRREGNASLDAGRPLGVSIEAVQAAAAPVAVAEETAIGG